MSDPENQARQIISRMYEKDAFTQWLGMERLDEGPGYSHLRMQVRKEMVNGFGIAHGGITYSLADSALAFACNSQGKKAVSIETSISHLQAVNVGDILTAKAAETSRGNKIATYNIEVTNQKNDVVALFKGMVYRRSEDWEID